MEGLVMIAKLLLAVIAVVVCLGLAYMTGIMTIVNALNCYFNSISSGYSEGVDNIDNNEAK